MQSQKFQTLEDIAQSVTDHLLPEIQAAVEVCQRSYMVDPAFNDTWTFGTQLWRNAWNRFQTLASNFDDCPFEVCGKGNEYKLKIGPFVVRHHRIDTETKIPKAAKAVKLAAHSVQMMLFSDEWQPSFEVDNIIIAIDADVKEGLREVFIGELVSSSVESNKFSWETRVPIFLADGAEASEAEIIKIADMAEIKRFAPEEKIPEISIGLDQAKTNTKSVESEGDK